MAGDLEDFLKRAAQRRQAKAAAQRQQQPRERPQYSNSRTERVVREVDPEEVITAEVLDAEVLDAEVLDQDSIAERARRIEEAKRSAEAIAAETARKHRKSNTLPKQTPKLSGTPAKDLIRLLKKPGGIQQAILLKEVFDRPEHRW